MFFYVGAEACTAGFFINYLKDSSIAGFSADKAAQFLTGYYVVATIIGFISIYFLSTVLVYKNYNKSAIHMLNYFISTLKYLVIVESRYTFTKFS